MEFECDALEADKPAQVDPNRLYMNRQGNTLGFHRAHGFEEVTNFSVEVAGYVGDGLGMSSGTYFK